MEKRMHALGRHAGQGRIIRLSQSLFDYLLYVFRDFLRNGLAVAYTALVGSFIAFVAIRRAA